MTQTRNPHSTTSQPKTDPQSHTGPIATLGELRRTIRGTVTVDETAKVLGISRGKAFESVRNGDLPVLRLGHRYLVPVPRLLALLGVEDGGHE